MAVYTHSWSVQTTSLLTIQLQTTEHSSTTSYICRGINSIPNNNVVMSTGAYTPCSSKISDYICLPHCSCVARSVGQRAPLNTQCKHECAATHSPGPLFLSSFCFSSSKSALTIQHSGKDKISAHKPISLCLNIDDNAPVHSRPSDIQIL